ncbi:MAG: Fic family protein [Candidatus Omnitrophica bacterium]|nr:Fic family protein [Candidatus Omnitrophota bacterium]
MDRQLNDRILKKKEELDKLRPFPKSALRKLHEQIIVEWTYNSDAIEGNSLTLRETRLVLEDGLTISGKSLREHLETINHKEAIEFVEKLVQKNSVVNANAIRQIHALILSKIDDQEAGKYRDLKVFISGSKHVFPEAIEVPALMSDFNKWLSSKDRKQNYIEYAAQAHFKLVDIHPFVDGNGRTARLLMNLILMKYGFPPAVVLKVDRKKYYDCLEKGHKGKLEDFINFIGRSLERSLTMWIEMLTPSSKQKPGSKYLPIREIYKGTSYSQEYLSLLARRGKLEAVKFGRNWYTSKEAVDVYVKSQKGK